MHRHLSLLTAFLLLAALTALGLGCPDKPTGTPIDEIEIDSDLDGISDNDDTCPTVPNPLQTDTDGDGLGDMCVRLLVGDPRANDLDNCPVDYNIFQFDTDGDGLGDACDGALTLPESRSFTMAVSPNSPEGLDPTQTFELAQTIMDGIVLSQYVDWDGTAGSMESLGQAVDLAREFGLQVVLSVEIVADEIRTKIGPLPESFTDPASPDYIAPEDRNFTNPILRDIIKDWCLTLARNFTPEFMIVGVETDLYYFPDFITGETNPDGLNFVTLYKEIYNEIKAPSGSPTTTVSTSIQWDQFATADIIGLQDLYELHWSYVDLFEGYLDVFSFSTFPVAFTLFVMPEFVADTYLADIPNRVNVPIAIVETGWPSGGEGANGLFRSEGAQARYIPKLLKLTEGLDVRLLVWFFLSDIDPQIPGLEENFYSSGLLYPDGTRKQSFHVWDDLHALDLQQPVAR